MNRNEIFDRACKIVTIATTKSTVITKIIIEEMNTGAATEFLLDFMKVNYSCYYYHNYEG